MPSVLLQVSSCPFAASQQHRCLKPRLFELGASVLRQYSQTLYLRIVSCRHSCKQSKRSDYLSVCRWCRLLAFVLSLFPSFPFPSLLSRCWLFFLVRLSARCRAEFLWCTSCRSRSDNVTIA